VRQRNVILAEPFPLAALPQVFPRAMVRAAIDAEAAGERRRRSLPAPLVVYLNLALAALPNHGTEEALALLLAALPARTRAGWRRASSTSITAARRRLGPDVMHHLFAQVATPCATPAAAATTLAVPESPDNRAAFTPDLAARPHVHLTALTCPTTGALHAATWTPCRTAETPPLAATAEGSPAGLASVTADPRDGQAAALVGLPSPEADSLNGRPAAPAPSPGLLAGWSPAEAGITCQAGPAALPLELWPGVPVLRSRHAEGVIAEVWSLLCLHQAAVALRLSPFRGGPAPRRA
jgi:hypothetical protein